MAIVAAERLREVGGEVVAEADEAAHEGDVD